MTSAAGAGAGAAQGGCSAERPVLVWYRRDLRLADNPALAWAAGAGQPVVPLFVLDEEAGDTALGGASRWWLHGSLKALAKALEEQGSRLVLRCGAAEAVIVSLIAETGCSAIVWHRLYEPEAVIRDQRIKMECRKHGIEARSFNAALLFEPWDVRTGSGSGYRVFTPFWRRCLEHGFESPGGGVSHLPALRTWPVGDRLVDWGLRPQTPDWSAGLRKTWRPGEAAARERLDSFLRDAVGRYGDDRDRPGDSGTSMLSPRLRFGEIGPRQVAAAIGSMERGAGSDTFLRELGWREFAHHLLFHNPDMESENMRPAFDRMAWATTRSGSSAGGAAVPVIR